jgi:glycosyltransferase involved in cell wall biosynthesis
MTEALVSVVTPCYNSARFLGETIASVAGQTYPAVEHIVVDDGSTDGSWAIVESHRDRVRGVRLDGNRGGGHARNRGAEAARGAYLMFLDADDTIGPATIGALVEAIESGGPEIVFTDWKRLFRLDDGWVEGPREHSLPAADSDPLAGWLEGVWVPPCAVLWSRGAYDATGGWDESLLVNQDGDLMMRALANGASLGFALGGTAFYRDHGGERLTVSGTTFSERQLRSLVRVLEKLRLQLEARGKFEAYREPLGVAYQRLALGAARQGQYAISRECAAIGEEYAGRRAISRTAPGRLLAWLVGVERKERLVTALAERGVATKARRQSLRLRETYRAGDPNGGKS